MRKKIEEKENLLGDIIEAFLNNMSLKEMDDFLFLLDIRVANKKNQILAKKRKALLGRTNIDSVWLTNNIMVTDPCYEKDVKHQVKLENTRKGEYKCTKLMIEDPCWGFRVAELQINHVSFPTLEPDIFLNDVGISVDSGQAGFFDDAYFLNNRTNKEWYDKICRITDDFSGQIDGLGVISRAGYGDGLYKLFVGKDPETKEIVAAKIQFIEPPKKKHETK